MHRAHGCRSLRRHAVLHLHGLEDEQAVAGADLLAGVHQHLQHLAGHGGDDLRSRQHRRVILRRSARQGRRQDVHPAADRDVVRIADTGDLGGVHDAVDGELHRRPVR